MSADILCRQAGGFSQPTKEQLLNFVGTFAQTHVNLEAHSDLAELVGKLWLYFEDPTEIKDDIAWVVSAAGNNEKKPRTFHPFVVDGCLIATDTHRVHIAKIGLKKEGWYNKNTIFPINRPYEIPDYLKFLRPLEDNAKLITLGDFKITGRDSLHYGSTKFNRRYIATAFSQHICMRAPRKIGTLEPLRLDSIDGKRTALIACMR